MRWPRVDAIAEPHGDVLQASGGARRDGHRRLANQVADDRDLLTHRRAVRVGRAPRSSGRGAAAAAAEPAAAAAEAAATTAADVACATAAAAAALSARSLRRRVVAARELL